MVLGVTMCASPLGTLVQFESSDAFCKPSSAHPASSSITAAHTYTPATTTHTRTPRVHHFAMLSNKFITLAGFVVLACTGAQAQGEAVGSNDDGAGGSLSSIISSALPTTDGQGLNSAISGVNTVAYTAVGGVSSVVPPVVSGVSSLVTSALGGVSTNVPSIVSGASSLVSGVAPINTGSSSDGDGSAASPTSTDSGTGSTPTDSGDGSGDDDGSNDDGAGNTRRGYHPRGAYYQRAH
ncbi:hypothetical protein L226DRAFT_558618 [Lentinus tigrinus ALCF2SS1-7]|uniref:uncharacterized protein n=1 Tax=Lentinus tigrinus ALCF2SS1-7 TaxID=1328758 RepID=UPI001165F0E2|nr:hypothetical protein L226DRAFT_558618 [Lentinus tigrinus ALCF2SS1-7]